MTLTESDRKLLLALAQSAIHNRVAPGNMEKQPIPVPTESLKLKCGAFVSVYVDGKLRGCIGTFSEAHTLFENVRNMAESAATSDSRFKPIEFNELERLRIEISTLSSREPIRGPEEIIPGKHGIYMEKGMNRGTLLPQVAVAQNWSVNEFLGNCAKYKAGIGWNGWKDADLYRFEAIIFSSEDPAEDC